jgi:DNA-binding GntR family transcriptional regulator
VKTNTVFKRAWNGLLAMLRARPIGSDLGSEIGLATALGVSRTTVRAILAAAAAAGLVDLRDRARRIVRHPVEEDSFPETETESIESVVERKFMEWTLRGDCRAGQQVNGLDLARQFGVSPSAVRDSLNRFATYGFVGRGRGGGWTFLGFNRAFADELCDIREVFELISAEKFCRIPPEDTVWRRLAVLEEQHVHLLSNVEERYCDFSELDERYHRLIYSASRNRFIDRFHETMRIVFHYHYLWNKVDEKERNIVAIQEHLAYIAALKSRDLGAVLTAARIHMRSVRTSLMAAIAES